MFIAGSRVRGEGAEVRGFNPNTGAALEPVYRHGDASHVEAACAAAAEAFDEFRNTSSEQRAAFLEAIAEQHRSDPR